MTIDLSPAECRILGALVEKELTTPDYYPLSVNALLNACNQKSNRLPVLNLGEAEIIPALDHLRHLGLAMQSREGGRVAKFSHTVREKLHLDDMELAILAELLLRGAQTPGELRARADRMKRIENLDIAERILSDLVDRDMPLVVKLPRQPGRKESRYMHLLSTRQDPPGESETNELLPQESGDDSKQGLAEQVAALREELTRLRKEFEDFRDQFD